MAWGLSSWLGLARCVQIFASLISSGMHGFLFGHLSINRLGLANNVIVLQFMMTSWFAFVVIAFSIVHTKGRSQKTTFLVATIVGDVCFIWVGLAIITLLSHAGLPSHCAGLTKSTYADDDSHREPPKGYTSIRFTNQWNGAKGELDRYCALERMFYGATLLLINLQLITIILSILRICQGTYIKKTEAQAQASEQILHVLREDEKLRSKSSSQVTPTSGSGDTSLVHHQQGHINCAITPIQPMPSEGTLGTRASVVNSRAQTHHHHHQCQHQDHHHHHHQQQQQPLLSPVSPTSASLFPEPARPSSPLPGPAPNKSSRTTFSDFETPEEEAAAAALITDGSSGGSSGRPDLESGYVGSSGLPPYTPGRLNPMNGHGNESNEMRLSGYVKGETRAQNMKDGFS